jgi:hypothetical protein
MATQNDTKSTIRSILISTLSGVILGVVLGSGFMFQYLKSDHVQLYKTGIGYFVFIKDKVYNLSELKSLN